MEHQLAFPHNFHSKARNTTRPDIQTRIPSEREPQKAQSDQTFVLACHYGSCFCLTPAKAQHKTRHAQSYNQNSVLETQYCKTDLSLFAFFL